MVDRRRLLALHQFISSLIVMMVISIVLRTASALRIQKGLLGGAIRPHPHGRTTSLNNKQPITGQHRSAFRQFGSMRSPGNPPGDVYIENNQQSLPIDLDRLRATASAIRKLAGYDTYDISLFLVEDEEMQEANRESRGVEAPTDILSFSFHPAQEPGVLVEPDFDIPDYYNLGDILIDVPYVIRKCQEDQEYEEDEEDRGVSGAMARVYDPETRVNMLVAHGILHLLGHDHETDEDYELMVAEEERILRALDMLS